MSINFADPAARNTSLLSDSSRKNEVLRLAQNVAAEHLAGGASQPPPQNPHNGNSSQPDVAKISAEAIEELSRGSRPEEIRRTDQLISALQEAFQNKAGDDKRQNQQGMDPAAQGEESQGQQKRLQKTKTVHWEPEAQAGQIHQGPEVIGRITVKEEVKEVDAPRQAAQGSSQGSPSGGSSNSSGSGNSAAGSGNASGRGNATSGSASASGSGNGGATLVAGGKDGLKAQEQDGKLDKESAAAAQSLKAAGLQAPGMEKGAENYEVGEKSQDFDVRSPATGTSQTLTIREAGKLGEGGQQLGTYKRLDDSPAMRYVSLHSRGQGLEQTAKEYAQQAARMGEDPAAIAKGVERLKSTTADG